MQRETFFNVVAAVLIAVSVGACSKKDSQSTSSPNPEGSSEATAEVQPQTTAQEEPSFQLSDKDLAAVVKPIVKPTMKKATVNANAETLDCCKCPGGTIYGQCPNHEGKPPPGCTKTTCQCDDFSQTWSFNDPGVDLTPFTKPAFASVLRFGVGFRTRSA